MKRLRYLVRMIGLSAWRGLIGFYEGDNLTYAASIAYYALLSLFPFFMLAFSLLGRVAVEATRAWSSASPAPSALCGARSACSAPSRRR